MMHRGLCALCILQRLRYQYVCRSSVLLIGLLAQAHKRSICTFCIPSATHHHQLPQATPEAHSRRSPHAPPSPAAGDDRQSLAEAAEAEAELLADVLNLLVPSAAQLYKQVGPRRGCLLQGGCCMCMPLLLQCLPSRRLPVAGARCLQGVRPPAWCSA
jgi:hypothetical protein